MEGVNPLPHECPMCGQGLTDQHRMCPNCGERVRGTEPRPTWQPSQISGSRSAFLVILGLVYYPLFFWLGRTLERTFFYSHRYSTTQDWMLMLFYLAFLMVLPLFMTHAVWGFADCRERLHWGARLNCTLTMYAWVVCAMFRPMMFL